jgi:hypothetical protein
LEYRYVSVIVSNSFSEAEPTNWQPAIALSKCFEDTQCADQHSHRPHAPRMSIA